MFYKDLLSINPLLEEFVSSIPPSLDGRFSVVRYKPFSIIHHKDTPLEAIGILLEGSFRVINEFENGNIFMIEMNDPISFVGEITLLAGRGTTSVTLETVKECIIAFLPVNIFSAWLDSDARFARRMAEHVAGKLYISSYNRGERLFYSSGYVFLKYLIGEADRLWSDDVALISKTRRQMSEETGLQEKTINRLVSKLEAEGNLSLVKGKIHLDAAQFEGCEQELGHYKTIGRNGV